MKTYSQLFVHIKRRTIQTVLVALLAPMALVALAPTQFTAPANAAPTVAVTTSGPLTMTNTSWNVLGLDSNNPNTGPNSFPVGAKVCNTDTSTALVTDLSWNWVDTPTATPFSIRGPASYTETITAGACIYAYWSVDIVRAKASWDDERKYYIAATSGANTVNTNPNLKLKVEKLVSQARNDVKTLTLTGSLANIGDTATVTMTGQTATAYEQLTAWPVFDLSIAHIKSMNFTFDNDQSTNISSPLPLIYADACKWDPIAFACLESGKAGGNVTITMVIERFASGGLNMNGIIYDLSGSSYHYNSDYGTDGLLGAAAIGGAGVIAENDSYFTPKGTTLNATSVGTNDTPTAGVTFTKLTNPETGTVTVFDTTTATFTYVPPTATYSGIVDFTYKICLTATPTDCSTATVTIVVGIQAVDNYYETPFQSSLSSKNLSANDYRGTYVLGTDITFETSTAVSSGTITAFDTSTATFSYTPANGFYGTVTFDYIMCRTNCATPTETSTATVTIKVGPGAVNDSYSTAQNTAVSGNVKTNDNFNTSDTSTVTINSTASANGTVTLNSTTGAFTYTPNTGFLGTATFTYDLCDSAGLCSTATVTITVNAPAPAPVTITWPTPTPIQNPTPLSNTQLNATALCQGSEVTGTYTYSPALGTILAPGTHTLTVTFTPTSGGCRAASTTVQIVVDAPLVTITWPTPTPIRYPTPLSNTQLNATALCEGVAVTGIYTYNPALGTILAPGTYTLTVTFTPTSGGCQGASTTVQLVVETPLVTITWPTPTPIRYPTPLSNTQLNATALCQGVAVTGTYTYSPVLGTILEPGTYTLTVTFNPTSGGCQGASTTVQLVVEKPFVTITWPTPTSIQYPTPLSNTQLNATALCQGVAVTGTYTYSPVLGTILAPGTHTLTVTFTPTSGGCQGASTTVQIVVRAPVAPTITWPNAAPVVGPHTLTPTQLNATCSVPGTLTYDPALGTVLQPGTYTLKVTCTPTDPNYPPVSTTVTLVVEKQNPTITWSNPSPIIIGTPLLETELNALFSVPGTCVYTPALGTLLEVGFHTLSVTCTPTNGNLYNPMTTTVRIEVLPIERSTVTPVVILGGAPSTQPVPREAQGSRSRILTIGPCLTSATLNGARMTFTPGDGCSGRTYVTITTIINGRTTIVSIPVIIQVVPAPSKTGPVTFTEGKIWWTKSPNATSYEVTIWGESVCSTTTTSCDVVRTIGPKTPVLVIAKGNDGLTATSSAVYENKKPLIALNVYFDTAKFAIKPEGNAEIRRVAAIIKKEGFTRLIIEGHTDSKGGVDNQTLSNNRSKATSAALRKLLPKVSVKISGSAFKKPAASNKTPEGMALNRRSEVLVW